MEHRRRIHSGGDNGAHAFRAKLARQQGKLAHRPKVRHKSVGRQSTSRFPEQAYH